MAKRISVEFFPPRTPEGFEKLKDVRRVLAELDPEFFSVTFGAGGSTREGTLATIKDIHAARLPAAPHLSCIGVARDELRATLAGYRDLGIERIVALRGDLPSGVGYGSGEFRFARELVEFARAETGDHFHIEVAAYPEMHPQAKSPAEDLNNLVAKFEAGADSAITQYFFNADAYFRLVDDLRARGIDARFPVRPHRFRAGIGTAVLDTDGPAGASGVVQPFAIDFQHAMTRLEGIEILLGGRGVSRRYEKEFAWHGCAYSRPHPPCPTSKKIFYATCALKPRSGSSIRCSATLIPGLRS